MAVLIEWPLSGARIASQNVRHWAKLATIPAKIPAEIPAEIIVAKAHQFSLSYTLAWCHARSSALSNRRSPLWCKVDHALHTAWLFARSTQDRALA